MFSSVHLNGFFDRYPKEVQTLLNSKTEWRSSLPCTDSAQICTVSGDGEENILLIGDSIVGVYASALLKDKSLYKTLTPIVKAHCPYVENAIRSDRKWSCDENGNEVIQKYINDNDFDIVIYGGRYSYYFNRNLLGKHFVSATQDKRFDLKEQFRKTFDDLISKSKKIIFLSEQSEYVGKEFLSKELINYITKHQFEDLAALDFKSINKKYSERIVKRRNEDMYNMLVSLEHIEKVEFFNLDNILCPKGECAAFIDGELIYYDKHHLTQYGAELVVSKLKESF